MDVDGPCACPVCAPFLGLLMIAGINEDTWVKALAERRSRKDAEALGGIGWIDDILVIPSDANAQIRLEPLDSKLTVLPEGLEALYFCDLLDAGHEERRIVGAHMLAGPDFIHSRV